MPHSVLLNKLSEEKRDALIQELYEKQNKKCFICDEEINLSIQEPDIDHIIPLATDNKDEKNNLALTHSKCNREKQDTNLSVARCMKRFDKIQSQIYKETGKSPNLSHMLEKYGGSKFDLPIEISNGMVSYTLDGVDKEATVYKTPLIKDELSGFQSFFAYLPIEYIYHDELGINPRNLSERVKELIKEFNAKRPQLHVGLARINIDGTSNKAKVFIFDGQHKAAAQILLGARKTILRVFVNPTLEVLTQTNERAGTSLRQIAFDLSVRRQLGSTILAWKIEKYQKIHNLQGDEYPFSEKELITFYRGAEGREVKKFILDYVRNEIVSHKDNKLRDYVTFGGKEKEKPLSYSAIEKTLFSALLSQEPLDVRPFFSKARQNEISNMVTLMNMLVSEIFTDYDFTLTAFKIEDDVRKEREGSSTRHIPDPHLRVLRMTKEEVMFNWVRYIKQIAINYFTNKGSPISDESQLFQEDFDDRLWKLIENFLRNLKGLPLWVDREKTYVFSAKNTFDYWADVFKTGKTKENVILLSEGINLMQMIRDKSH